VQGAERELDTECAKWKRERSTRGRGSDDVEQCGGHQLEQTPTNQPDLRLSCHRKAALLPSKTGLIGIGAETVKSEASSASRRVGACHFCSYLSKLWHRRRAEDRNSIALLEMLICTASWTARQCTE
jgi:hypothetical protein